MSEKPVPCWDPFLPGEGRHTATHMECVLTTTEKILWPPKAEDDVYGICPAGCVEQLFPGPESRRHWKSGRRRLHPRGSFCGGIRKTGKCLVFTCGSVGVHVCESNNPVCVVAVVLVVGNFPYPESSSFPSRKPGNMRKGKGGKLSFIPHLLTNHRNVMK